MTANRSVELIDNRGRRLFVCDGISNGRAWGTFYRKPSGSLKRLVSKNLPIRCTRVLAEADLRQYGHQHRLQ